MGYQPIKSSRPEILHPPGCEHSYCGECYALLPDGKMSLVCPCCGRAFKHKSVNPLLNRPSHNKLDLVIQEYHPIEEIGEMLARAWDGLVAWMASFYDTLGAVLLAFMLSFGAAIRLLTSWWGFHYPAERDVYMSGQSNTVLLTLMKAIEDEIAARKEQIELYAPTPEYGVWLEDAGIEHEDDSEGEKLGEHDSLPISPYTGEPYDPKWGIQVRSRGRR